MVEKPSVSGSLNHITSTVSQEVSGHHKIAINYQISLEKGSWVNSLGKARYFLIKLQNLNSTVLKSTKVSVHLKNIYIWPCPGKKSYFEKSHSSFIAKFGQ